MAAKKRGQNEGTISQRADGRSMAKITVGYKSGKQVRKCLYGKTRDEVAKAMVAAQASLQKGIELPNEKISVEKFLSSWLEGTAKNRVRESTFARYKVLIENHISPHIRKVVLARLSPQQVQYVWNTLPKGGACTAHHHSMPRFLAVCP